MYNYEAFQPNNNNKGTTCIGRKISFRKRQWFSILFLPKFEACTIT